jgi:hypothetical protein
MAGKMILRYTMDMLLERRLCARETQGTDAEAFVNTFITRGNAELLSQKKLAVFATNAVQNLEQHQFAELFGCLKSLPLALTGGWHSFLEKILFNSATVNDHANYIYYLARDLNSYHFSEQQLRLMEADKLLVIARQSAQKRINRHTAGWRNRLIYSQMNGILFLYIRPEGILHACFEQLLKEGHRIFILDIPENRRFICEDTVPVQTENAAELLIL